MNLWKKKSTSGTGLMACSEEKALTVEQIQAIMEQCSKFNVLKLKFGTLNIEFDRPTNPNRLDQKIDPVPPETLKKSEEDAILRDEVALRDEQIKEMHITDPLRAEELLLDGKIESDDTDGE